MELVKSNNIYIFKCSFAEKDIPKEAGFKWDTMARKWWTSDVNIAYKLIKYASPEVVEIIQNDLIAEKEKIEKLKEKAKNYQASFEEIKGKFPRIIHYQDEIRVYTKYDDRINDDLYQKFKLKWDADKKCRIGEIDIILSLYKFGVEHNFIFSKEFYLKKEEYRLEIEQKIKESKAVKLENGLDVPAPPGLSYMPFQLVAIKYALDRNGRVLFADEMGTGKTIEVLGWLNITPDGFPVLVVCPAVMKEQWKKEAEKWLVYDNLKIQIISGESGNYIAENTNFVIINYDILEANYELLKTVAFNTIIFDESHYIKNYKAKRTQIAQLLAKDIKYRFCLSGTPFLNRPVEGFTTFNLIRPDLFPNFFDYARRYCGAKRTRYGWDFSSATNTDELQTILRMHLMIRRPKEEVLKELPPKRRTLIPITLEDRDITQHYDKFLQILNAYITERNTIRNISDKEQQKILYEELRGKTANLISEFENLRQEAVYKKLPFAIQFIKNMLEQVNKVVVFAHHRKVIETVYEEFKDIAVVLYGETAEKERDKVVKRFQEDENVKLFIGSLRASAFGITLTASSNVVFLEFDWTPAVHLQAEDRCHRIGQKNAINIYYLALDNSIDIEMAKILEKKQTMIESLVDDIEKERISKLSIFDELLLLKGG